MNNVEVAQYLLRKGLPTMAGVVFLDEEDRQMVLVREGYPGPRAWLLMGVTGSVEAESNGHTSRSHRCTARKCTSTNTPTSPNRSACQRPTGKFFHSCRLRVLAGDRVGTPSGVGVPTFTGKY